LFKTAKLTFWSLQVIAVGAIQQDTCDILLVFRCNYVSIAFSALGPYAWHGRKLVLD